nr:MAG TPA: hypothetical protein [Bacteriophage sp.]
MNEKNEVEIIKLLKKQNSLLCNIYKKLDGIDKRSLTLKRSYEDVNNISRVPLTSSSDQTIPQLTENEKTLEICHVVRNGILYTFNQGICVEQRVANKFENYVHRQAD